MVDKLITSEITDSPYYNDFDETKSFHSILFRPGFSVQARELTQLQTILQKQIQRFGDHVFKNGSIVSGAQITADTAVTLNLNSQYLGTDITINNFLRKYINNTTNTATTQATAYVLTGESGSSPSLMIKYVTGDEFANDTIKAANTSEFAVISGNPSRGSICSIGDGVVFFDGYFVLVTAQTIILEKYSTTPSYRVGLEIDKSIVEPTSDTSLLDPALEASNYQAPGATRYKITATLAKRSLTSTDDSQFIELLRIENGVIKTIVKYPVYSELEKTLARRTNDESGSYTVRPFTITLKDHANTPSNSDLFTITLSPGKAYIQGFEYETISPLDITAKRSRNSSNVNNYPLSIAYGHYIFATNANSTGGATSTGFFKIDDTGIGPQLLDLHSVNRNSINSNTAFAYTSTKIGTARLLNVDYDSASNTQNSSTYRYKLYIADTQFSNLTGIIFSNTSNNTIVLANVSNLSSSQNTSATSNAYLGAIIRIASGTLSGLTRTIVNYDGTTRTATLDSNIAAISIAANTDRYSIDFTSRNMRSLANVVIGTPVTIGGSMDVDIPSIIQGNTIISDASYSKLVFEFPQNFIRQNIIDQSYNYFKVLQTGASSTAGTTGAISLPSGEVFPVNGTQSTTQILENFLVVIRDNRGTAIGSNGAILPLTTTGSSIVVNNSGTPTATFTAAGGVTFTADILAKVTITSGNRINEKIKTLVTSNNTHIRTQGGSANATFANVAVYSSVGQVHLTAPNKVPNRYDTLYTSDVISIDRVYDIGTSALTDGTAMSSFTDITSRYAIDTGQRDDHYNHGGIKLLPGYSPPSGNVVVCFSYFRHETGGSDGLGYFSVDSYPSYANIPTYTSIATGENIDLRDAIDFRPRRQDNSNVAPGYVLQNFRVGYPNEEFSADYQFYLARKDKVVLTKERQIQLIEGAPSLSPISPKEPADSMVLYNITVPPYTAFVQNVVVKYVENKRYTMKDIGSLEKRIENLEYYTSLNLLEKDTETMSIKDVNGLDRTKNGILVDSFKGHSIGDVRNPDYVCSIDFRREELRPSINSNPQFLDYDFTNSSGVTFNSGIVTLPYTTEIFLAQNTATQTVDVQPYLIARFLGSVKMFPETDYFFDKYELPDVVVNYTGENDGYQSLQTALSGVTSAYDAEFGNWETRSSGFELVTNDVNENGRNNLQLWENGVERVAQPSNASRGFLKRTSFDQITRTVNDRVVNLGIQPIMRKIDIDFVGFGARPRKTVYFYFDDTNVTNYVQRANELVFTGNNFLNQGNSERITSGSGNTANVIFSNSLTSTNVAYITDVTGNVLGGQTWTGARSGNTGVVVSYTHYSGTIRSANNTSMNLAFDAANTDSWYVGNTIYLVSGSGEGTSYRIDSYVGATRTVSNTLGFSIVPTSNTRYSIGESKTNEFGQISGIFVVPKNQNVKFRTGEHLFRVMDVSNNNSNTASTLLIGRFVSEGLIGIDVGVKTTRIPEPIVYTYESRDFGAGYGSNDQSDYGGNFG